MLVIDSEKYHKYIMHMDTSYMKGIFEVPEHYPNIEGSRYDNNSLVTYGQVCFYKWSYNCYHI